MHGRADSAGEREADAIGGKGHTSGVVDVVYQIVNGALHGSGWA